MILNPTNIWMCYVYLTAAKVGLILAEFNQGHYGYNHPVSYQNHYHGHQQESFIKAITITREVPVIQHVPIHIERNNPIPVHVPVPVPVPQPYPVVKNILVPVVKPLPFGIPILKKIPIPIPRPFVVRIPKLFFIPVHKPSFNHQLHRNFNSNYGGYGYQH